MLKVKYVVNYTSINRKYIIKFLKNPSSFEFLPIKPMNLLAIHKNVLNYS